MKKETTIRTIFFIVLSQFCCSYAQDSSWFNNYTRRIHMDFHTPALESDLAFSDFDAKQYVQTLKDARVNSLVTFAKGHHGHSYYNTEIGLKHPNLPKDVDMMGEIIEECHKNDMKVLAYYSVGWLTTIEKQKPEWMERNEQGEMIGTDGRHQNVYWNCICLNSPYLDEVVLPELKELAAGYTMDGFWIDIIENNACYCDYCKTKFKKEHGREYKDFAEAKAFSNKTRYESVEKMVNVIKKENPAALVSYNTASRDKAALPLVDFCSIETHPGSPWHQEAWSHALLTIKYMQQFNKPWETTTSRFIHGWGGWDDQTTENMLAVASRITAHGGVINLGDQTYPTGKLDAAIYDKIKTVYSKIEMMEPWALNATPFAEVAILSTGFDIYSIYHDPGKLDNYQGAVKILTDKHWSFNLVEENADADFSKYKCIILPEIGELKPSVVTKLNQFVKDGGTLLITGNSSFSEEQNNFQLSEIMGLSYVNKSPYRNGYLDMDDKVSTDLRKSPLLVPGQFFELKTIDDCEVLSEHIYPIIETKPDELFFFRNSELSPPGEKSVSPAIVKHSYGKGSVIYCAAPVFKVFYKESQWYIKDVVNNLLNSLVPEKAVVLDAPNSVEMYLAEKDNYFVINLINYHLQNETNQVEDIIPIHNLKFKVTSALFEEKDIEVVGENTNFTVTNDGNYIEITLESVDMYSQVVVGKK